MNTIVDPSLCPRCGSPIPAEAPGGQCPKCLLGAVAAAGVASSGPPQVGEWPTLEEVRLAFPDLEVDSEIGRGGMAVVFKARQMHLDRPVALKILAPWLAAEPGFAERFSREARVLAKLNHPNIVTIHDFGQASRFFYLLMEYVDGVNLRQAMEVGRFEPGQALALVPKICDALQYAHGEGILHRDIKPDNILLDARGRLKIADFGIAKLAGEHEPVVALTRSGMRLGTPAYMAPEQVEKPGDVDHRADIYSLGVVLYELLTGELPLGRFAPPSEKASVDARIDEIVLRTLEKERERRYQSAEEVKTQVEGVGGAPPPPPPRPNAMPGSAGGLDAHGSMSRKAVSGAIATALSFCAAALGMVSYAMPVLQVTNGPGGHPAPGNPAILLGILLLILVVGVIGCALAGILLGSAGLEDIRRSGGRRSGVGLAVFAVLTWPLLVLTGVGAGISATMAEALFDAGFQPNLGRWLMAVTFMLGMAGVLWLDWAIIRKVLRWARGGEALAAGAPIAPPIGHSTALATVAAGTDSASDTTPKTSGLALASGILALISLMPASLLGGVYLVGMLMTGGRGGPMPGLAWVEFVLLGLVSGLPGLVGMILGLVAMRRIRHSRGRLGGVGWAVLGGLTWPALLPGLVLGSVAAVGMDRLVPGTLGELMGVVVGLGLAVSLGIWVFRAGFRWTSGSNPEKAVGMVGKWMIAAVAAVVLLGMLPILLARQHVSRAGPAFSPAHRTSVVDTWGPARADLATLVVNEATQSSEWTQARPVQVEKLELNVAATLAAHRRLICELRHTGKGRADAKVWPVDEATFLTGQLDGGPLTLHRNFAFELPEGAGIEALQEAHRQINNNWLHLSRNVVLGRPESLFRVRLADGSMFEAAFILQDARGSD